MLNRQQLYFGTVATKIALARSLYEQHGKALLADPAICAQLATLSGLSQALADKMAALKMGECCTQCGCRANGGCCSAYMANETDAVLLLINLLQGHEVARQREDEVECLFLNGQTGCTLSPKPMFCLNYNCRHILAQDPTLLASLATATGDILRGQTALEEDILHRIR
ncbi:MAG: hypothetical protein OEV73_03655 [Desulfobulbaceae bacterium]|nr:hypothetical protein [Desulfobulbaceae bacterium]